MENVWQIILKIIFILLTIIMSFFIPVKDPGRLPALLQACSAVQALPRLVSCQLNTAEGPALDAKTTSRPQASPLSNPESASADFGYPASQSAGAGTAPLNNL